MGNFEQQSWTVGGSEKIINFLKILQNYTKLSPERQEEYLEKNWLPRSKAKQLNDFVNEKFSDKKVTRNEYQEIVRYLNDLKNSAKKESINARLAIKKEIEIKRSNYEYLWQVTPETTLYRTCVNNGIKYKKENVVWGEFTETTIPVWTLVYKKWNKIYLWEPDDISNQVAQVERKETKTWVSLLLDKQEKRLWDNFNYVSFIREHWLTSDIQEVALKLIEKNLGCKNIPRSVLLKNIKTFVAFTTDMETDWKNVNNTEWSSAKWYFQYLNKNWNRYKWRFTSFETALRNCYMFYTWKKYPPIKKYSNDNLPDWVKTAYNTVWFDPKKLSAEQQSILFLINTFYKWWTNKHLKNMLTNWNQYAMRTLYEKYHHTRSKWATKARVNNKIAKWWPKLKKRA